MKQYASIEYFGKNIGIPTVAFEKLDGSNLRFEFSKKRGFYKFGSKKMMIDRNTEIFGKGVDIFLNKYADELGKVFRLKQYREIQSFVCFAEFFGTKSRFGYHEANDEFDVVLFDVDQFKKGFVPPKQFVNDFGHTGIPKVVYEGNLNREFYQKVKENKVEGFEDKLWEGVVCKSKVDKGFTNLYYTKIKTDLWLNELKARYGEERLKEEFKGGIDNE